MQLFLKDIQFESFRTFKDKQSIENLPNNGLIGILGKNLNTNGSNDSGKSNFHLSIAYALGYCPYPLPEMQSWHSNKPIQVQLNLKTKENKEISIRRGHETSINIENELFLGARIVENKVNDLIKIPIHLLEALTFREQGEKGRFLSMTGSEKRDFLATLLSLDIFENQIIETNKKISNLEKLVLFNESIVEELKKQLFKPDEPKYKSINHLKETLERAQKDKNDILNKQLSLSDIINNLNIKINHIKSEPFNLSVNESSDIKIHELEKEIKQLNQDVGNESIEIENKIKALQEQLFICDNNIKLVSKEASKLNQLMDKINLEKATLELLKQNKCITCKQNWNPELEQENKLIENIKILELLIKSSTKSQELQVKFENERSEISLQLLNIDRSKFDQLKNKLTENSIEISNRKQNIQSTNLKLLNEFEATKRLQIEKIEEELVYPLSIYKENDRQISEYNKIITQLESDISYTKIINTNQEVNYQKELMKFNSLFNTITEKESEFRVLKRSLDENVDFALMLKSFLGVIVQQVLEEISIEVNDMLKDISNVNTVNISFNTETITQKGIIKQEIKPIFYKNGIIVSSRSGLSGGQKTSIHLATDLAIIKVVTRRMGFSPGWLVLDEPFDGHDVSSKESCLELLKKFSQDRLIFIIDHTEQVKEHFDRVIEIENYNGISYVKNA